MIQLTDKIYAVPMGNAEGCEIRGMHPGRQYEVLSFYGEKPAIALPEGSWRIICASKDVTITQAKQIVERTHPGGFGRSGEEYKHYQQKNGVCFSALYSLETLFASKGCDNSKQYCLIEKI
jgi:hypothetical protein